MVDNRFRMKYHPEDSVKRKEEQMNYLKVSFKSDFDFCSNLSLYFLKKRVEVFLDLLGSGKFNTVSVDCSRTNDLLKLLDTVVVKLEGGTDEDLAVLEHEYTGKLFLICIKHYKHFLFDFRNRREKTRTEKSRGLCH